MKLKELLEYDEELETIFINPTKQELLSFSKKFKDWAFGKGEPIEFRYVLSKKGDLYVGSSYYVVHDVLAKKVGEKIPLDKTGYINVLNNEIFDPIGRNKNKNLQNLTTVSFNENMFYEKDFTGPTILLNPTKQELLKLAKLEDPRKANSVGFRYILQKNGDLYFAIAFGSTHNDMRRKLSKSDVNFQGSMFGYLTYLKDSGKWNLYGGKFRDNLYRNKNMKKILGNSKLNEEKDTLLTTILFNPTKQEFLNLVKQLRSAGIKLYEGVIDFRFIFDDKNNFYIASGYSMIHLDMILKINKLKKIKDIMSGYLDYNPKKDKFIFPMRPSDIQKAMKNKNLRKLLGSSLNESLDYIKFKYSGENMTDPIPRVKILDTDYPGIKGQKTYGERKDLLGWNVNHFKNKRYAKRAIDDIESFAKLLSADKEEVYKRIKYFFPEQAKFIRRYMKKHVKGLKHRKGILWRNTTYPEIKAYNKEAF